MIESEATKTIIVSFLGAFGVGKKTFLQKIAKEDPQKIEEPKNENYIKVYTQYFNKYKLVFNNIVACDVTKASVVFKDFNNPIQSSSLIIIMFSRNKPTQYNFACEMLKSLSASQTPIFFIENKEDLEKSNEIELNEEFENIVSQKFCSCSALNNDKNYLFQLMLFIIFNYLLQMNTPDLNINFPSRDVQNLVATAYNKSTFILTENSIHMKSPRNPNNFSYFPFHEDFLFHRPVSLIANHDGSKLILATHFQIFLIDKVHSNFDPMEIFPGINKILPFELDIETPRNSHFVDIQFFPFVSDIFAIAFSDRIQVMKIFDHEIKLLFTHFTDQNVNIKMFKLFPFFDEAPLQLLFNLYYLTDSHNLICSSAKFLFGDGKLKDKISGADLKVVEDPAVNNGISFEVKGERIQIKEYDQSSNYICQSVDKDKQFKILAFDFDNKYLVVHTSGFECCLQYFLFTRTVKKKEIILKNIINSPHSIDNFIGFRRSGLLYAKSSNDLYVVAQNGADICIHKAIESRDIIGFGGSQMFCVVSPGFIINLTMKFTRVSPKYFYSESKICELNIQSEYEELEKKKTELKNNNESIAVLKQSEDIQKRSKELKEKGDKIKKDTEELEKKLEQLQKTAEEILVQMRLKRQIQSSEENAWSTALEAKNADLFRP